MCVKKQAKALQRLEEKEIDSALEACKRSLQIRLQMTNFDSFEHFLEEYIKNIK